MRTWLEIDMNAIKHNYTAFRETLSSRSLLMGVVKSNAYGHCLVDYSRELERVGVNWLAVDSFIEGKRLRSEDINTPILVLGYTDPSNVCSARELNISLTVADVDYLKEISKKIGNGNKLNIHLKVDSGMNRQGVFYEDLPELIELFSSNSALLLQGVYTHFARAKDPLEREETERQINYFKKSVSYLKEELGKNFLTHACATAGSLLYKEAHFDMVRVGIGLYGLWPSKEIEEYFQGKITLKPALSWKVVVGQVKKASNGDFVGYGFSKKLDRDSILAVLPFGYWHGYPRALSNKGVVLINGQEASVVGYVSMDMVVVDVTDISSVSRGDTAVIVGRSQDKIVTLEDLATASDRTIYELVTCINPKIRRVFL